MREVKKATSHGGKSIRSIFIFAITTIMVAFFSFAPLNNNASAITTPISDEVQNIQTSQNLNNNANTNNTANNVVSSGGSAITTDGEAAADAKPTTSCAIDGIGWMICPITKFLAGGMDWIYSVLSTFLKVEPMSNNPDTAIFKAWSYMRSFANIAFVIAFLIIIYSQMTNLGMSNYGIKKLLPRLIVAAILVNVSYYICAVAVDISNVLGTAVQQLFTAIREKLLTADVSSTTVPTWSSVVTLILGGGGALAGTFVTVSLMEVGGLATFIVPAVLGAILAVFVAFIIMAARQALITILIILSPLAFVAYLLPNTDQWFKKWKSTLMTMLLLFPIFSVIFGGSQLASIAIIQNAHSMAVVILGLLLQAAPLLITPMLMKFSGSILAKVGGMVNNPSKGLIDRSRNWGKDVRSRNISRNLNRDKFMESQGKKDRNLARGAYRELNRRKYRREFERDEALSAVKERMTSDYLSKKMVNSDALRRDAVSQQSSNEKAVYTGALDRMHEELKSGSSRFVIGKKPNGEDITMDLSSVAKQSKYSTKVVALNGIAAQIAKKKQQENISRSLLETDGPRGELIEGKSALDFASGIGGENGRYTALASAVAANRDADGKLIGERTQVIKHFNPSGSQQIDYITGNSDITVVNQDSGESFTFKRDDPYMMEAMIDDKLKKSAYSDIIKIMQMSGDELYDYRVTISNAIPGNGLAAKIPYLGGKTIGDVGQGKINAATLEKAAQNYFFDGRFGTEILAGAEADAIKDIIKAAQDIINNPADMAREKKITEQEVIDKAQSSLKTLVQDSITILDPDKTGGRGATGLVRDSLKDIVKGYATQAGITYDPKILD